MHVSVRGAVQTVVVSAASGMVIVRDPRALDGVVVLWTGAGRMRTSCVGRAPP
jgi:hypothetical protein